MNMQIKDGCLKQNTTMLSHREHGNYKRQIIRFHDMETFSRRQSTNDFVERLHKTELI